jgi:tetratricopeptide (TPR) repeat protein
MSLIELNIRFSNPQQFVIKFEESETAALNFTQPFENKDFSDLAWYLETYASSYITDVDEQQAKKIEQRLKELGEKLFNSIFSDFEARRIFNAFQDTEEKRLITMSANHTSILRLPWELLREPKGTFLMNEKLSIRRRYAGAGSGRKPFKIQTKDKLQLLFVVSRPSDAGFLNPRSEAQAVMRALQETKANVEIEFLRPATLENLIKRLENENLPPIDIVHFDGHGTFVENKDHQPRETAKETHEGLVKKTDTNNHNGYLVFEDEQGEKDLVSAEDLGNALYRKKIGLVVLSACQSAKMGGEEALNSIAARLTDAGLPAVLAMTYSVLVSTTEKLFAQFYENLMHGRHLGESLDNSRRYLDRNDERGERQSGQNRIILKLKDWFVPVLYQAAGDQALLNKQSKQTQPVDFKDNHNLLNLQEAGFIGRSRELWEIERNFVKKVRRITITGFGGQGKTYLAIEAGLWLLETGFFDRVCFMSYAAFQGVNALEVAISALSVVLKESFLDNQQVINALNKTKTLIILDNLESLSAEALHELLTVAKQWSETGESRLLITTRSPDLKHADFSKQSFKHRYLPLEGLYAEDALRYFQILQQLGDPPKFASPLREALLTLFQKVAFHPLSISLLAMQLKDRRPAEVGERLERYLLENKDNYLLSSLKLSLDRLNPQHLDLIKNLGVFQGGAFEDDLLTITEIEKTVWNELKENLKQSGLIQSEDLRHLGIAFPYLTFHPTLAPALWQQLNAEQQSRLLNRYCEAYYQLSDFLYDQDSTNVHATRAIAWRELPNLLHAVNVALENQQTFAVNFVVYISWFLNFFGLQKDQAFLTQRAEKLCGEIGSESWYLTKSNQGEQLFQAGQYDQAALIFQETLKNIRETNSYNYCVTLTGLGCCFNQQGNQNQSIDCYQQALTIARQLEQSVDVKRHIGGLYINLADAFVDSGDFKQAKLHYEQSLALKKETDDARGEAAVNFQMGTLAMLQGNLAEAEQRYQIALKTFQTLQEPAQEAIVWHQLGVVCHEAQHYELAERAYRQSAHLKEIQGNLAGAATTWNQLATVNVFQGKLDSAEKWYRKAIEVKKQGNPKELANSLNNLANLLQDQPHRLKEAQQLAEQALAICKTLDESSTEIWTTYNILTKIFEKQGDINKANFHRQLSRETYLRFAGMPYQMKQYANLIGGVVQVLLVPTLERGNKESNQTIEILQLKEALKQLPEDWQNLAKAIEQILDGERNETLLLEPLNYGEAAIVHLILQGIENPKNIAFLFSN